MKVEALAPTRPWAELSTEEQDKALCDLSPECCSYDGEVGQRDVTRHTLDDRTTLLLMECSTWGYNRETIAWTIAAGESPIAARIEGTPTEHGPWLPVSFENNETWLTSPYFQGVLISTDCGRGICDHGQRLELTWAGTAFRLARIRVRNDDCCAEIPGATLWPIVWPASEVCDYRWKIKDGRAALVSITPSGERENVMEELKGPCELSSNGTMLDCGGHWFPVTADGRDWVIWKRTGTLEEPGEPVVLRRVRRHCDIHTDP